MLVAIGARPHKPTKPRCRPVSGSPESRMAGQGDAMNGPAQSKPSDKGRARVAAVLRVYGISDLDRHAVRQRRPRFGGSFSSSAGSTFNASASFPIVLRLA
jgi:hypothetical protein